MTIVQIPHKVIENHLNSLFTPQTRSKGLGIFNEGDVMEVNIHPETAVITSTVKGTLTYNQTIKINESNRFLSGAHCTCPVGNVCKHSAAVLHFLLYKDPDVVDPESDQGKTLEKGANFYRTLGEADTFKDLVEEYGYKGANEYVDKMSIALLPTNEINIKSYEVKFYLKNEPRLIADILLKLDNGILATKCLTCDSGTNKLCKHQRLTFEHIEKHFTLSDLKVGNFDYQFHCKLGANTYQISPELFQDSFDLQIDKGRVIYHKTNEIILDKEDIDRFSRLLKTGNIRSEDFIKENNDNEESWGHALIWTGSFDHKKRFQLVEGRLGKNYDRLTSTLTPSSLPKHFPARQLNTFSKIDSIQKGDQSSMWDYYSDLKECILQDLDNVNTMIHYIDLDDLYPDVSRTNLDTFSFSEDILTITASAQMSDMGYALAFDCTSVDGTPISLENLKYTPLFAIKKSIAYLYDHPGLASVLTALNGRTQLLFTPIQYQEFITIVNELLRFLPVDIHPDIMKRSITLEGLNRQIYMKEVGKFILFEPYLANEEISINLLTSNGVLKESHYYDVASEEKSAYLDILKKLHPKFDLTLFVQDFLYLDINEVTNDLWFLDFYEKCTAFNIELFGQEKFNKLNLSPHRAKINHVVSSGIDWFDVDVEMTFGDQRVVTTDWIKAIKEDRKFVKLTDGTVGLIPQEWLSKLKQLVQAGEVVNGEMKVSKFKFNIIDELFENIDDRKVLEELKDKKHKLLSHDFRTKYALPAAVKAEYRPYQIEGYQWLRTMDEIGWGGILADDMGLGKTLQVIALLSSVRDKSPHANLVIVPRTLVFNWCKEIEKFNPNLKYFVHYGIDRDIDQTVFDKYDIVITTYTIMVNDIKELRHIQWHYVVLDESQAIKNVASQRYKAACLLKSKNRICMTGTPIENNTFELFAQMNFINGAMLGSQKAFKDQYAIPIDTNSDESTSFMLKKTIQPFVMRRTKEVVAKDLPEKSESIIYCEMGNEQRKVYEDVKSQIRSDLQGKLDNEGLNKSRFFVLEALLRLRQICNSPELVSEELSKKQKESIKIEMLMEQLTEELNDHNALVFSQFTSMLSLIRKELDLRGIKYSYLDGSTQKRQEVVEEFSDNDEIKIFLISLKAGNTGLNLVKADYVYIVDPWWNPAVEAQAIDRTHRIGQDKNIFAYKMVCKDTIEEKILKLQEKKKKVATDIISTDENILKSLDKSEVMALFD